MVFFRNGKVYVLGEDRAELVLDYTFSIFDFEWFLFSYVFFMYFRSYLSFIYGFSILSVYSKRLLSALYRGW